jgi:hypothetical protein
VWFRYLPDRRAKSDNIAERLSVSNPAPVTDILGRVNTGKEEELFQNRVPPKLRSFVWNSFLSSDSSLPPPGYRGKVRHRPQACHPLRKELSHRAREHPALVKGMVVRALAVAGHWTWEHARSVRADSRCSAGARGNAHRSTLAKCRDVGSAWTFPRCLRTTHPKHPSPPFLTKSG